MARSSAEHKTARTALSTEAFVKQLEAIVDNPGRNRLHHPFVEAVAAGTASTDQIAGWLHQFQLWADPANKFLGDMWSNCPDDDLREGLLENMLEEEYGRYSETEGHMRLIERTLGELGWDDKRRSEDETRYESWAFRHWLEVVDAPSALRRGDLLDIVHRRADEYGGLRQDRDGAEGAL